MTPAAPRKKLIEVSIPLEAINAEARRRKQKAPKGYPTSIHKYWAQRPVAACRAVLFSQLVDDPSSWPDLFPTADAQEIERKRLHRLIERLVPWDASKDRDLIRAARWEIAKTAARSSGKRPPSPDNDQEILRFLADNLPMVADPFSGAGSIPFEAQRLGVGVYASDLNSVSVLISKALVEFPAKCAGKPPVNPEAQAKFGGAGDWRGRSAEGLAEDIRYYARWLLERAEARLSEIYPNVSLGKNTNVPPVAWMWVRTIRSPDPSTAGARVPLASTFLLSTGVKLKVWVEPEMDSSAMDGYRFVVRRGTPDSILELRMKNGTKAGRGANFTCILSGAPITSEYVRVEASAGRLGFRLTAIVADGAKGRVYLQPDAEQERLALSIEAPAIAELDIEMPTNPRWFSPPSYGMRTYKQLYTPRQITGLKTLADLVSAASTEIIKDAKDSGRFDDIYCTEYSKIVSTYLSMSIARVALYGSSLCRWLTKDNALGAAIPQKAIEMSWDFAESNLLGSSSASIELCAKNISECILHANYEDSNTVTITQKDARFIEDGQIRIWNTDPPYYDNIGYAGVSEYFYLWHRRALSSLWPELFRRLGTNKDDELIATPYLDRRPTNVADAEWSSLDARQRAERFFFEEIKKTFTGMAKRAAEDYPSIIYYAFRQQEETEEGLTSAGWATVLQALVDGGFAIDGTWPLRTESSSALKTNINSLASSIVLVCRKANLKGQIVTKAEFVRALKREMPDAIDAIRKAGVGPVDMQQSVIGPGMGVFTRYAKVLESDDSPMTVKTALTLINRVWEEIENELDANFDPETQVALAWFASYGYETKKSGELNVVANAKNVPDKALFEAMVFKNLHGNTALTPRIELPLEWRPSTDKHLTVWRCVQQVARMLKAEQGGGEAAAKLVAEMGSGAADAQKLAYRLFEISTRKGLSDEALVYNELAQEWAKLEDLAESLTSAQKVKTQASFQF